MANLNALLGAAKKGYAPLKQDNCELPMQEKKIITKDSSREDILDYIMIFLCERIDIEVSVFKGGYVLTKLMPDEACMTEDIDFSISEEHQYYDIIPVLEDLGNSMVQLGVVTGYEVKPTIGEHSSGGIHMMTPGNIPDLKIDIGWRDLSWGVSNWSCVGFDCKRFEVERMLSDKISAIYSRKRFRRTKDIYDFYILTNNFDVNLSKLKECIINRGLIDWNADPFREEVVTQYAKAYDKLTVATCDGRIINKPELNKILLRLRDFMENYNNDVTWDHVERVFK